MLLDRVYNDFVTHTNLTDSIYKSVFVGIDELFSKISVLDWLAITYKDYEERSFNFNFSEVDEIPRYVVELVQNVFKNFYTLPNSASIKINVSYKNVEYEITNTSKGTTIPEDLDFLNGMDIIDWFILDKPVIDLFGEFNKIFKFIDTFKSPVVSIYEPLKKKLEKTEAAESVIDKNISKNTVAKNKLAVEGLQKKIKDILADIDTIRQTRDQLQIDKNNLFGKVNSREILLSEKEKLSIEHQTLSETREDYIKKRDQLQNVVSEIDTVLADLNANVDSGGNANVSQEEIGLYVEKKAIFEKDIESKNVSIRDFDNILNNALDRLKAITNDLSEIEEYTVNDIETIDAKIHNLNKEQEDLYGILIGLEGELKHQKSMMEKNAVKLEKAASTSVYSDMAIQNVETTAIAGHISTSLQPVSVETVVNYLRYYFFYYATVTSKDLLSHYENVDTYMVQAVASRITLLRYFGIYFNKMFSAIDFVDNRIGKVIRITED